MTALGSPNVTPWDRSQAVSLLTAVQVEDDELVAGLVAGIAAAGRLEAVLFTMTALAVSHMREVARLKGTTAEALIQAAALGLHHFDL